MNWNDLFYHFWVEVGEFLFHHHRHHHHHHHKHPHLAGIRIVWGHPVPK